MAEPDHGGSVSPGDAVRRPASGPALPANGRPAATRLDLLAWLGLAAATLVTLWPLGLTNRVLSGVDAFTYFTPYWAYRMAALRAGHLPLWDPYLFLGVPFLANPQAAVLYPLHWPLSWLSPAQALIWSAMVHIWLAAGFTYTFARRSLGLSRPASFLAGLLFGLSGYTLARIENINQLNALAWLPAMLWLYDATAGAATWRPRVRWGAGLAVAIAMALLAGHTQSTFIDLVGLALYAAVKLAYALWPRPRGGKAPIIAAALLPFLALLPAGLLSAAQLLPTLELNGLGLRTGGLPYRQAVSFSLRPRLLSQTLLPPLGGGLAGTFGSEGYAEFAGWLGVAALVLAGVGLVRGLAPGRAARPADTAGSPGAEAELQTAHPGKPTRTAARRFVLPGLDAPTAALALLAAVGFLLALGLYDPLYYVLWRFVPGFALFRAPARWLALYTLGLAGLAGAGLDALLPDRHRATTPTAPAEGGDPAPARSTARRWLVPAGIVILLALVISQQLPHWPVVAGWLAAGLLAAALCLIALWNPTAPDAADKHRGHARATVARGCLIALALAELWLGGRALPFTLATAPAATDGLRNAPAALLAATAGQPAAGRDRFLSLSNIQFDPGDLAELRRLEGDRLAPEALDRFVRTAKQMEVLAPNLSLLLRLPAVDGYDGGILPLDRYVKLQSLFLAPGAGVPAGAPPRTPIPDGRLREQLRQIPPDKLLDLTATRYILTDKQNDLWEKDVYYDLEQPVTLAAGDTLRLDLSAYTPFSATALGVVSSLTDPARGSGPAATMSLAAADGRHVSLDLAPTGDTGWAQAAGTAQGATIARQWPDWMGPGHDYLALKEFSAGTGCTAANSAEQTAPACPLTPLTVTVTVRADLGARLVLRGLTLIDRRTAAHQSITLAPRGDRRLIYSGDVKIYERTTATGRAWLVHNTETVAGDAAALARLTDPSFDPRQTAILTQAAPGAPTEAPGSSTPAGPDESVQTLRFDAETIALRTTASRPGLMVLADAAYPGWQAQIDGRAVPILPVDLLFRGVLIPAGSHEVTFAYRPASWQRGRLVSMIALALLAAGFALTFAPRRRGLAGSKGIS